MSEREVHPDLRAMLMAGEPFQYAHLIKFERPSRPDALSGKVSTSAQRYVYITDGSRDVAFDDGSKDLNGVRNGTQTYIANKVLNVSNVQESSEAKASSFTITLDGNGIGATATGSVTITAATANHWDIAWPANVDLISQGFREGDKVEFTGIITGEFNIDSFRADNVLRIKKIDVNATAGSGTVTMTLDSEEIKSILLNKNSADYSSFINREVFIYRAYFQEGAMVGPAAPDGTGLSGPILLFKGIISSVAFDEDESGIKVQWSLTSHWGDFAQIKGRITSDDFHRALDANAMPQPYSAIKPIYAYDKGFIHSETSINLLASYTVAVTKETYKLKKSGLFGLKRKLKVTKTIVNETHNTQLDFQLQARSIPVCYGVRNIAGIPIFADTLNNDSSEVYVIYALSEGEVGGIYDVYINGKSLICNDEKDATARTQNTENTVDVVCRGRADRGDVLGGVVATAGTPVNYYYHTDPDSGFLYDYRIENSLSFNPGAYSYYVPYQPPAAETTAEVTSGRGVIHGETITLTEPQSIILDFFSGTEGQAAASQIVQHAQNKNFKVQNDYWTGKDSAEYWGPNHRLVDTAYIVAKYKIKEGDTTIPDLEFILRSKVIECYNYDYSYAHDEKMTGEDANNFALGSTVTLSTGQTVQIIDKWKFFRPDGVLEHRFRFSEIPNLNYVEGVPGITRFSMSSGGNTWTMTTFNYVLNSGTVGATQQVENVSIAPNNGNVTVVASSPIPGGSGAIYSLVGEGGNYNNALLSGTVSGGNLDTLLDFNTMER